MNKKGFVIYSIFTGLCIVAIYGYLAFMHFAYPIAYKDEIIHYSKQNNLACELVASLINAESSFKPNAVSSRGAIGLMQLMPTTAKWVAEQNNLEYNQQNLYDAEYNIKLGTLYLSYLTQKFSDTTVVLCAYNAGEGVTQTWLSSPKYSTDGKTLTDIPYSSTAAYVKKIFNSLKIYSNKLK